MGGRIVMRHPTLPPTQTVTVDERAARHLSRSGWQAVPEDETPAAPAAAPAAAQAPAPTTTPRRRRAQEQE